MKNIRTALVLTATVLGLASSAQAGFTNGGFEAGNFSGWTVTRGINGNGTGFVAVAGAADVSIVDSSYSDPYAPTLTFPFNGSKTAMLNTFGNGNDAVRISQLGTMLAGETSVFVNWAAVLEDPGHLADDQPFFNITINKNGSFFAGESKVAGAGGGWLTGGAGPNDPGAIIRYNSGTFTVGGLNTGDTVEVILTVLDCELSGHAGWAYLDGIGTTYQPPSGVPDGGSTALLFTPILLGLAAFRRRR